MTQQKKSMDKITKGFIIFMVAAFVILSVVAVFGNRSYELKGLAKTGQPQQSQNAGTSGSGSPEFQPYLEEIHKQISGKWQPPAVNKDSEVVLKFTVLKNGHVINEQVSQSSGIKEVDESALTALRRSSPLPPLPLSFPRDQVTVNFNFTVRANQY
jgi:TonB family protein